ncbi:hypothetical protein OPT61_g10007 [Boeremia exigua]|uniref:Uncharacterized protein n=1 Tax=Boeremia exigua TaxID=749465 RepID=A0ACC2HSC4_9PLEO|nr:hypothetical protein OPT61_g10007 [Boeremia exigua]
MSRSRIVALRSQGRPAGQDCPQAGSSGSSLDRQAQTTADASNCRVGVRGLTARRRHQHACHRRHGAAHDDARHRPGPVARRRGAARRARAAAEAVRACPRRAAAWQPRLAQPADRPREAREAAARRRSQRRRDAHLAQRAPPKHHHLHCAPAAQEAADAPSTTPSWPACAPRKRHAPTSAC